jgi:hypothetical protein
MVSQYAVVTYDSRPHDDNEIEVIHITDNYDYANKLAFHYAKKDLPPKCDFAWTEYRIIKDYYNERCSVILRNVIVDYRICEVKYDDECEEYEKYNIVDVWNNVWAVVQINNEIEEVKDIDEKLIYKD